VSFSSEDAEHLYYVVGWAFRSVVKQVRRLTHAASTTEEETKLAHMAQFLRHDLNLSDAPTQVVFVDAVERKPSALFRATEPAALFGEALEARIHAWLTTERLAVLGGELIGRVEDKLTENNALREMFDLCFPPNIADIVNVTPSQAEAMRVEPTGSGHRANDEVPREILCGASARRAAAQNHTKAGDAGEIAVPGGQGESERESRAEAW
jgi:hypothetical protein